MRPLNTRAACGRAAAGVCRARAPPKTPRPCALTHQQIGFALLEAGAVRTAVAKQVPYKVLLTTCVALLGWWAVGDACAFGGHAASLRQPHGFVGGSGFFLRAAHTGTAAPSGADTVNDALRFAQWLLQV